MTETIRVEIAVEYTDRAGKKHHPDKQAVLPASEALRAIQSGYAREISPATARKAAAKTTAKRAARATKATTKTAPPSGQADDNTPEG